jgi:putative glutamine amidotransferase
VWLAGARPVRISVSQRTPAEHLDAVIVSGGDDIHPGLYGSEHLADKEYDHDRDALEQSYIRYAIDERLPLMGICRGYQLINVMMGGSLHVDIRNMRNKTSNFGTVLPRKTVVLKDGSFIARLTGAHRLRVNSLHYQAVDRVGEELKVTGRDLDDFVQVLEHYDDAPILGVQWHPEYLFYLPSHMKLFRWLVDQAGARRRVQA